MDETEITKFKDLGKSWQPKERNMLQRLRVGNVALRLQSCVPSMQQVPPMFIFPRKRMVAALMNGAPPESVGYCSPNGWIDADLFVK